VGVYGLQISSTPDQKISDRRKGEIDMSFKVLLNILLILILSGLSRPQNTPAVNSIPESSYAGMQWRLVGPFRAGWATVAAGIPYQPDTFYFGSAGGGVWKTIDAGRTWRGLMQHETASAIGALAIAQSNPLIIYAGTGQVTMRYDDMAGDGVFRSEDGGETWRNMGLKATRHIGSILIDPIDPQRVLVAALGHAFGPNPERGVFLTNDGGQHWKKVLYVDDKTGAVDLASDPGKPKVIYAAMWQMRQHPWLDYFQPQAGPGSGIYKSTDGGDHWVRLAGRGLPDGPLDRIGLGVPNGSAGSIVYATIVAPKGKKGFYRSDDGGKTWRLLNEDREIADNYFSRITVSPENPDIVYVMGRSIHVSMDGGKTFTIMKGSPGGDDYHFLWINPNDTDRMITASDQGAVVTMNGGKTWSSWYNQPTGQLYHVAADDRFPYHIYSGQQDNGTVEIASRGPYGVIEERDWHPVGGDERDYMVPKPGNPDIVFGSGLGGYVSRSDEVTRQVTNISPWPVSSYGARPTTVRYRYTWLTPLVFSPLGDHPMYFAAQVLFRSNDDGDHWDLVSPDLTGKKDNAGDCQNPDLEAARKCGYGVIYSIAPSPISEDVIWVGTDNGLIQLSTDKGANWKDVTPETIPLWGRINAIAPSPFSEHAAYAAVDLHRLDRFEPLMLKTKDDGKTWQIINNGLPLDQYVTVVRADPERQGLLYAGTDRSVYVSFDDGGHWKSLCLNFPTTWVRDLLVHKGDLIAATQGRGIWALDNLAPLRELAPEVTAAPSYLFEPSPAWRLRSSENQDTPPPPSTPLGQNPPTGAIIDYWIKEQQEGEVTLTISDSTGHEIQKFSSNDIPAELPADRYFQKGWLREELRLSNEPGMHRFVWDLRYPRPPALKYKYSIAAVWDKGTPILPEGALVLPGRYTVTLTVDGKSHTQSFQVKLDPRIHAALSALHGQLALAIKVDSTLARAVSMHRKINAILEKEKDNLPSAIVDSVIALTNAKDNSISEVANVLANLSDAVKKADSAPTQGQQEVFSEYRDQLDHLLKRWEKTETAMNKEKS
jgi:photosystem II stability/assembly factor-like uncharacterized protein